MLRHKSIDRICCIVLAFTLVLTCGFMGAAATGLISQERIIGYEHRLFDQSRVHTIDIVMDDWEAFLEACTSEQYSDCTIIIDGESYGGVGIRGKGNTSLSSVQSYGNDRYSFKVEFDQYQSGKNYHGLDKLSLNNLIQDKTYMKDYIAYTLMNRMGVAAPLCSFAQISVNGEPWGLYLAVEGVEDSFLSRNYGSDSGELYKPDSMSFGGGRGNGREFDMEAFSEEFKERADSEQVASKSFDPGQMRGGQRDDARGMGGGMGAMGSSDVMLQYTDDDPDSYANIFNNAKTDVNETDQQRLIEALKSLSEGKDIESVVDTDSVLRYLVVHNFLCNDDSYTGAMVHNYYLYEEDGVLSMIPWDYNLAFGGFSMGGSSGATSTINSPIDSPVSSGEISSRPIISWIFESETYTTQYHELYAQFIADTFESGWLAEELARVSEMIAPYVETETRAFFTYEEFQTGAAELAEFCDLRAKSIAGQLNGSIPSTREGQSADASALIDGSGVDLSAMGDFNRGGHGGMDNMGGKGFGGEMRQMAEDAFLGSMPAGGMQMMDGMTMPGQPGMGQMPMQGSGLEMPQGMMMQPQMNGQMQPAETVEEPAEEAEAPTDGTDENPFEVPEFPSEQLPAETTAGSASAWMLLVSLIVLLVAILFAKFYRTNR